MALIVVVSLSVLAVVASAAPIYSTPLAYVALSPIPENIYNQVQDTKSGEYAFGYAGGPVAREEARTADGVTRGAYSYVDAHGIVQHYRYVADADGFRVAGTNIPTDESSSSHHQYLQPSIDAQLVEESPADKPEASSSRKKRSASVSEIPVAVDAAYALPAAPLTFTGYFSAPTATSTQSRVQIHRTLKTEIHTPVEVVSAAGVVAAPAVAVPAIPVEGITKTVEAAAAATPIAVAASVPLATSSQSRFQIHNSFKAEIHEPLEQLPVAVETVAAAAVPIAVKTIEASPAVPIVAHPAASVATATSSQRRFQVHSSAKLEFEAQPQHPGYQVLDLQPVVAVQEEKSASLPSITRHPVGVGLGVVSSPLVAYNTYGTTLLAEA